MALQSLMQSGTGTCTFIDIITLGKLKIYYQSSGYFANQKTTKREKTMRSKQPTPLPSINLLLPHPQLTQNPLLPHNLLLHARRPTEENLGPLRIAETPSLTLLHRTP